MHDLLIEKWKVRLTVLKAVFDTFMELQDDIHLQMILLCLQLVGAKNWWHRYLKKITSPSQLKTPHVIVFVFKFGIGIVVFFYQIKRAKKR